MSLILPLFVLFCLLIGAWRRVPLYDAFLEGAKEGLRTAAGILPALITMLCGVQGLAASGLTDALCRWLSPIFSGLGIPQEAAPLVLLRPLSGSGSNAMLQSIFAAYGPDSPAGIYASVVAGAGETVFYTCALYLGAAGVRKSRHILPCAMLSYLTGVAAAGLLT